MPLDTLIVDDSESFRRLLRARLESLGCQIVAQAANSEAALPLFRIHNPRLVTLDLVMTEADRFGAKQLFSTIRSESPETAILVISARSRHSDASSFLAAGAIGYLEKSFMDFDKVATVLKRIFPEIEAIPPARCN